MKLICCLLAVWLLSFSGQDFTDVYSYTKMFSDENSFLLNVAEGEVNISDVTMKAKYGSGKGWCEISSEYFSFFVPKSISDKSWGFSGFYFSVTGSGNLKFLGSQTPYIKIESKQADNKIDFYFSHEFGLLGVSLDGDLNTLALCSSPSCKW